VIPYIGILLKDTVDVLLENGLLKLIQSLELKRESGEWIDQLVVKEINEIYETK
jgi:hypothetical protein